MRRSQTVPKVASAALRSEEVVPAVGRNSPGHASPPLQRFCLASIHGLWNLLTRQEASSSTEHQGQALSAAPNLLHYRTCGRPLPDKLAAGRLLRERPCNIPLLPKQTEGWNPWSRSTTPGGSAGQPLEQMGNRAKAGMEFGGDWWLRDFWEGFSADLLGRHGRPHCDKEICRGHEMGLGTMKNLCEARLNSCGKMMNEICSLDSTGKAGIWLENLDFGGCDVSRLARRLCQEMTVGAP
jgi:hypothetical protein